MDCIYCYGEINENAIKCKHCGEWLDPNHFISIINATDGFQNIQNSLVAHVSETINSKLKTTITIVIPIVLLLLGGVGASLVNSAINDAKLTMTKAEYIVDNADTAVKKILNANESFDQLEKDKKRIQSELLKLNDESRILRDQTSDEISLVRNRLSEIASESTESINLKLNNLRNRILLSEQQSQTPFTKQFIVNKENIIDDDAKLIEEELNKKIEYVKYKIFVGSYKGKKDSSNEILKTLISNNFTALIHEFRNKPKPDEKFTSIVVQKNLPENFIRDLLTFLSEYKGYYEYIRFTEDTSQDLSIFIFANSKKQIETKSILLDDKFWNRIKNKQIDIKSLIDEYSQANK